MNQIHLALLIAAVVPGTALPCTICGGDFQNQRSLRQEIAAARVVVVGTLSNARTDGSGDGQTDLTIDHVIKGRAELGGATALTVPRYYPGDGSGPIRGVFFFEIRGGRLQLLAGRTIRSEAVASYLKSVAALPDGRVDVALAFFVQHLDHADADIAADAFLELARASDADVARASRSADARRLRRLVTNPNAPPAHAGLAAFLLACAGESNDAELLRRLLVDLREDRQTMRRGLLAGYIILKPAEGWPLLNGMIRDSKRGFLERYAALGVLEFFHNWQPREHREPILNAMKLAVESTDLIDMAIENLRRWGWWDLTELILAQFNQTAAQESVIAKQAILRYALACPLPAAQRLAADVKKRDPELYAAAAQSLEDEKSIDR